MQEKALVPRAEQSAQSDGAGEPCSAGPTKWFQRLTCQINRAFLLAVFAFGVGVAVAPNEANAGQQCEEGKLRPEALSSAMALAQLTHQSLESEFLRTGAQVMLIARAGQDLSKYGLAYSHLGFVYRTPSGSWQVVHKLNLCSSAEGVIYRQGLAEFFLDNPHRYQAGWVALSPSLQPAVIGLISDDQSVIKLHHRPYSIVSYVWGRQYQQSNQWAIETLAAAAEPAISNRVQAQAWLMLKGYEPSVLMIPTLTRLGGRIAMANVAFDDHPNEDRFSNRIATVTVDSIFRWLRRTNLGGDINTVRL